VRASSSEYGREAVGGRFSGTTARPTARSPRYDREAVGSREPDPERQRGV